MTTPARQFITKNGLWLTFDEIVDDLEQRMSIADKKTIANNTQAELALLHHGFGTWIRNSYDLWHGNPLTEQWRTNPAGRDIRNNVDYSPDHPDSVSTRIIEALWQRLGYLRKP